MSATDAIMYAVGACREYERWAQTVEALTEKIGECVCPHEAAPEMETHFPGWPSCFAQASEELVLEHPNDPASERPRNLDEIAAEVADCESCTRLVSYIRQRKHARQRYGVAKRKVRHAGKRLLPDASLAQALTGLLERYACTGDEPEVKAAREALVAHGYPDPLDFGEVGRG